MTDSPASDSNGPRVVLPGDGEVIEVGGIEHLFKLTAAHTGGRLALEEFVLGPGEMGARPHIHSGHDEYFYVLEGELTIHDGARESDVGAGTLVAAVRGTAHGYRNATMSPVRGICLFTPAGYENYFRDVHEALADGAALTDELLAAHRLRFGTTSV